jgi:hypothetical protein
LIKGHQISFLRDVAATPVVDIAKFCEAEADSQRLIVVVVPENDFMKEINVNTRATIVLCIVALIVSDIFNALNRFATQM